MELMELCQGSEEVVADPCSFNKPGFNEPMRPIINNYAIVMPYMLMPI